MNHDKPPINAPANQAEIGPEPVGEQAAAELGGLALDATSTSQLAPNIEQMTRVEKAYFQSSPEDLLRLINEGVIGVDDVDFEGRTPIMMMTAQGHTAAVEALITKGANLNCINMYQDRIPMSALDAAHQTKRGALVELLVEKGAKRGREIHAENLAAQQNE